MPHIDIPAAQPGWPSLATHLERVLKLIQDHADLSEHPEVNEALQALRALPTLPSGQERVGEKVYWKQEDGSLIPEDLVKPARLLEDEFVRRVALGALSTNATLARYKRLSFSEGVSLLETLAQDYRVKLGGKKGNVSMRTMDGAYTVRIATQDRIIFGPGIAVARTLLQEWLDEEEGSDAIKAAICSAFGLDQENKVRVAEVLRLRRFAIASPKWQSAMAAIDKATDVIGSSEYLRVYRRGDDGKEAQIVLDLASVQGGQE